MSTFSTRGNIVSTTKTVKHLNARRRATWSIFFEWVDYIQEFFSGPAHRRNSVESSFQNPLRNFFRRLESHIAEAASWPERR